jgi:hypothetical protein
MLPNLPKWASGDGMLNSPLSGLRSANPPSLTHRGLPVILQGNVRDTLAELLVHQFGASLCTLNLAGRPAATRTEFQVALAAGEAPATYLNLCLNALASPPNGPSTSPTTGSAGVGAAPHDPRRGQPPVGGDVGLSSTRAGACPCGTGRKARGRSLPRQSRACASSACWRRHARKTRLA